MTVDDIMVPRSEIIGIDINDDWKSILRQLSHSLTGASCSTVIRWTTPSVCCEYVKLAVDVGEKRVHQRNHARAGTDLFCAGRYAAQHAVGKVSAQQKKVGLSSTVWRHSGAGDG